MRTFATRIGMLLVVFLAPAKANALAGEDTSDQCAVCRDEARLHMVCDDVWPYDCWWEYSEHHRLGSEEHIVNTFAGDGVHSSWEIGGCIDVHGECSANFAYNTTEDVLHIAGIYRQQLQYVKARGVIQLLDCEGGVTAQMPLVAELTSLLRVIGQV